MKQFDIEAYLDGELDQPEREAFESEMLSNPAFAQEVRLLRQLTGDVETQLLREQVKDALSAAGKGGNNKNPKWWLGGLGGVLVLCVAGYFLFFSAPPTPPVDEGTRWPETPNFPGEAATAPQDDPKIEQAIPVPDQPQNKPAAPSKKKSTPSRPIAENKPPVDLLPPSYPSPNVRGQNDGNEAWKALVDQVWYTAFSPAGTSFEAPFDRAAQLLEKRDFPKAYVRLQLQERKTPDNDTLLFMKAYCLLEMGEGGEALKYFDQSPSLPASWETSRQWFKGLAYLLVGSKDEAIQIFDVIKADPGHPFRGQSEKALTLLQ